MSNLIVVQFNARKQEQDANLDHGQSRIAFKQYIHGLMEEYAEYNFVGVTLDIQKLPLYEKRLLLSHVLDADDYEDSLRSPTATEAYLSDTERYMKEIISEVCEEAYQDFMEESGFQSRQDQSNGEIIWSNKSCR